MSVVYKCKECGGDVQLLENGLGKCLYCGALQTLPKEKDDKISDLLNRANDYRLHCDFDRAIFTYEQVLDLKESEPEAHWGLFLSKYGVEYVKDSMTFTYKPTLHRISAVSVFDDADYQATIKYASPFSVTKYNQDASDIEAVMKELLLLSANQEPYDVFLSYKEADDITRQRTNDSYLAHDLYNELTGKGYKVFFAPKSLGVGLYEPKIYSAIISAKVMIVLGTKPEYFDAVWVKNEWSRFAELIDNGEQKVIVPVYKDMKAEQLPNRLAKFQAYDMASISFLSSLSEKISKYANNKSQVSFDKDTSAEAAYLERGFLALEDANFTNANKFFENVLNLNPHNSEAYFGKLMCEINIKSSSQMQQDYLKSSQLAKPLRLYNNFANSFKFADQQFKSKLLRYEDEAMRALILRRQEDKKIEIEHFQYNSQKELDSIEKEIMKKRSDLYELNLLKNKLDMIYNRIEKYRNDGDFDNDYNTLFDMTASRINHLYLFIESCQELWHTAGEIIESKKRLMDTSSFRIKSRKTERWNIQQLQLRYKEKYRDIAKLSKCALNDLDKEDHFFFGEYNGMPLEWIVMEKEHSKILCLTRYCIKFTKYDEFERKANWDKSTIRTWLNGDFYNNSFNEDQKDKIISTDVSTFLNSKGKSNAQHTIDKVFIFSEEEYSKYYVSSPCIPFFNSTAINCGVSVWLRSWGEAKYAYYVSSNEKPKGILSVSAKSTSGIFPVIWINTK